MRDQSYKSDPIIVAVSFAAMLVVWQIGAWLTGDASVLPGPAEVISVMWDEAVNGPLLRHLWATLVRVGAAFSIAMIVGGAIGILLGRAPKLDRWANPWVIVLLNIPALVVIVLCYLWIGLNELAAITAVTVNKTAMVTVTIREGVRVLDRGVGEMAQVFRLSPWVRFRHVTLPQLAPFIASSARNGLAVIWKIVLVVEFLGRSNGIGFQIHLYFQLVDLAHVLAYSLSFVLVMVAVEYLILKRFD
ncbi:MAG: NitT/TauT family transport system permease protein [Halocynthiibacter sp.]